MTTSGPADNRDKRRKAPGETDRALPACNGWRSAIRCYFLRDGHISAVELLTDASDEAAIESAQQLYEQRKNRYAGFEVWDRARFVYRYPPAPLECTVQAATDNNPEEQS